AKDPRAVGARIQRWLEARTSDRERITPVAPPSNASTGERASARSAPTAAGSVDEPGTARKDPARTGALEPSPAGSLTGAQPPRQLVLFVDQLEELLTLADARDAGAATAALATLLQCTPGLRLIATVRSDFLARLSALPGLGDAVTRALYLLKPLTIHGVRE